MLSSLRMASVAYDTGKVVIKQLLQFFPRLIMNMKTTNYKTSKQICLYTTQFAATKNTNYHRNRDNAVKN